MNLDELSLKVTSLLRRTGLSNVSKQALVGIATIGVVLIVLACWHFWPHDSQAFITSSSDASMSQDASNQNLSGASQDESMDSILVDVEGAVNDPGLHALPAGSRIGDAIDAAGGLRADASKGAVNLAQVVNDGDQVIIRTESEEAALGDGNSGNVSSGPTYSNAGSIDSSSNSNGKININTASADELQQLSGVGPSLSERIIQYRETNGRFKTIDELQNVSGIGQTRFDNIKDKICV